MTVPIDIEVLRVRIGLEPDDASRDADIDAAMAITLDMIEEYLDRKLLFEPDVEELFGPLRHILVRRWPIDAVTPIVITHYDGMGSTTIYESTQFQTDRFNGIVHLCGYHQGFPLKIEYSGGLQEFPSSLEWAFLQVFDAIWASDPAFGGSAGGDVWTEGAIKKVSLVGIGSVDLGASSGGTGTGGDGISDPWSLISSPVIDLLNRYRRQSTIGAG